MRVTQSVKTVVHYTFRTLSFALMMTVEGRVDLEQCSEERLIGTSIPGRLSVPIPELAGRRIDLKHCDTVPEQQLLGSHVPHHSGNRPKLAAAGFEPGYQRGV